MAAAHLEKSSVGLSALALVFVALAGWLCLARPFWGDQALFTLYARELTRGAVLYRDVFDVKQPGIFAFYLIGGALFGFTEVGIHLFELAYWLAFSVFAVFALRPYFTTHWGAPLLPVCTVAVYYFYAGLLDLTQIEILVGFPLLVAWWLIDQADPATRRGLRRYAAAGLVAAVVVLLKHLYFLMILAFLAYTVQRARKRDISITVIQRCLGAFLLALVVPLLVVVAYFAAYGQLGRIWWAYFQLSAAAQLLSPRPLEYLIGGLRRFMIGHAPILILAAIGALHGLRQRIRPQLDLVAGMLLWLALGGITFVVLQGWPEYKWALFTVPCGVLAVIGAETLIARMATLGTTRRRYILAAVAALAVLSFRVGTPIAQVQTRLLVSVVLGMGAALAAELLPFNPRTSRALLYVISAALAVSAGLAAIEPVNKVRTLEEHGFALTADARREFQRALNDSYLAVDTDLAVLYSGDVLPGPLYVFGDPLLLLRANRPQAVPILGWGPEYLDSRAWRELDTDLRTTLPPYIVIDGYIESFIRARYPPIIGLVDSRYKVAFVGSTGTWYVRRNTTSRGG